MGSSFIDSLTTGWSLYSNVDVVSPGILPFLKSNALRRFDNFPFIDNCFLPKHQQQLPLRACVCMFVPWRQTRKAHILWVKAKRNVLKT